MKSLLVLTIAALAISQAGCVTMRVDLVKQWKPPAGVNLAPVNNVHVGPTLLAREETIKDSGSVFIYPTGELFGLVFTGPQESAGKIELIEANCDRTILDRWPLFSQSKIIYTASFSFEYRGRRQVLSATGIGTTVGNGPKAVREATEKLIASLAGQVRTIIADLP